MCDLKILVFLQNVDLVTKLSNWNKRGIQIWEHLLESCTAFIANAYL